MCDCGEVEVLVSSQITVVCAGCGKKKAEQIIHLDLSSNEVGQSSNKVPVEDILCLYCTDGTLDKDCGDCHNVYPKTGYVDRCSEPDLNKLGCLYCCDCEWDGVPDAGRKLRPGEKAWKEKVSEWESKGEKGSSRWSEDDIEIVCDDLSGAAKDLVDKIAQEPSEPCRHENIVWERNSYRKYQRRCGDCKQWLPGSFPATVPMKEEGSWSDATEDIEELSEWGCKKVTKTPFDIYHEMNPYLED